MMLFVGKFSQKTGASYPAGLRSGRTDKCVHELLSFTAYALKNDVFSAHVNLIFWK